MTRNQSTTVNHYYCVDEDIGPFFLKFCSYFPYNANSALWREPYAS